MFKESCLVVDIMKMLSMNRNQHVWEGKLFVQKSQLQLAHIDIGVAWKFFLSNWKFFSRNMNPDTFTRKPVDDSLLARLSRKYSNAINDVSPMKRSSLTQQSLNSSTSLVDMLRKPFRRKSVPNSPVTGRSADPSSGVGQCPDDLEPQPLSLIVPDTHSHTRSRSVSLHSLNVVSY
ncbi:hypothetical protein J6590_014641 [Homalodisca vitripennis]|nr:hypothetical protein J6590_014641 [Homalodisca vitripennis]